MAQQSEGFLENVGHHVVGWAWLPADPLWRLRVSILFDDGCGTEVRAETTAQLYRADLEAAGKGDGRYGFSLPTPDTLIGCEHKVQVLLPDCPDRRLTGSPRTAIFALPPVTLRPARSVSADVERLQALLGELAELGGGNAATAVPTGLALVAWLSCTDHCWLVAERQGRFVGFCRVGSDWPTEPHSGKLSLGIELHPDVRGFGLGEALMRAAEGWATGRCSGLELAVLPHNERALRLYRKLGYTDVGLVLSPDRTPHRRMVLPLMPAAPRDFITQIV